MCNGTIAVLRVPELSGRKALDDGAAQRLGRSPMARTLKERQSAK